MGVLNRGELTLVSRSVLHCGGPQLPCSINCCGLSSTGFSRLQGLGARGSAAETAAAVLVEQSPVILSPFLLFQSVPCKEYLEESKVLQCCRKALPDVASSRMAGQARAGSSLHCTVWAREMRLWQPPTTIPTRNSEMLLKPRRKKHSLHQWIPFQTCAEEMSYSCWCWYSSAKQPEFPRSFISSPWSCVSVQEEPSAALPWCFHLAFLFFSTNDFLKKCLPNRRNIKRKLSINTTAV